MSVNLFSGFGWLADPIYTTRTHQNRKKRQFYFRKPNIFGIEYGLKISKIWFYEIKTKMTSTNHNFLFFFLF
jgi:hypothetical protein